MNLWDDERIYTFGLLLEAHSRLTRVLDAELRVTDGIPLQTFEVLLRLRRAPSGHMTMSELANAVAVTTGGVTRLADRLEKEGLVQRVACPEDRRVVYLALTTHGEEVLSAAVSNHLRHLDEHVGSRVDPADLPALHRVLDALRRDPVVVEAEP